MHRMFANRERSTETVGIPSYKFDIPLIALPKAPKPLINEKPRAFVGMNPNMANREKELSFDSSFESGNLD